MAKLTHNTPTEYFREHTLEIKDNDRIRIEVNGEYVTYMRCIDGTLAYLESEQIKAL